MAFEDPDLLNLTRRSMVIKFRGAVSTVRSLPGSSPQGVFLGSFFFIVKFNGAFLRPNIPRPLPKPIPVMVSNATSCTVKYIDDASHARSLDLRKVLIHDHSNRPRPLQYHERHEQVLNPLHNQLQKDLNELKSFTDNNLMVINQKKSMIMTFNFTKTLDFPPEFTIGDTDNDPLEIVSVTKLLGIMVSDDLKWNAHVEFMCKKASNKIWLLRRMKILNLEAEILLDFYCKEVRSILEFGVACWNGGLTQKMIDQIERIQKICVTIIVCDIDFDISYKVGCILLGIEPLCYRRKDMCVRFIQKTSCDPRHADLFTRTTNNFNTRQDHHLYREYTCKTKRFFNSPLCYLTRLLNTNPVKGCPKKG